MTSWNAYRSGALYFVVLAPFALVLLIGILVQCGFRKQRTSFPAFFWLLAILQAVALAGLISFWLHFVPCLWLSCDLGPEDDGTLRGLLWFVGWPAVTVLLLLSCLFGQEPGLVGRAYDVRLEQVYS